MLPSTDKAESPPHAGPRVCSGHSGTSAEVAPLALAEWAGAHRGALPHAGMETGRWLWHSKPEPCSWRTAAVPAAHGGGNLCGQFLPALLVHHSMNLLNWRRCSPPPHLNGVRRRDGGAPTASFRLPSEPKISGGTSPLGRSYREPRATRRSAYSTVAALRQVQLRPNPAAS